MTKTAFYIILFTLISLSVTGQNDPVLFTVDGSEIRLSEFNYIYSKNNGSKADYSKESVEEYLDLYTNFKLKVAEARDKRIDTLPSYIEELAGYRRQLADSYIVDKELSKRVAQQAYERMQKDIAVSHIQINLTIKSSKSKERIARKKIEAAQKALESGRSFAEVVQEFSEDKRSKQRDGSLGYMTAILPEGFYDLEVALYNTPVGEVSNIVRSKLGFHILKVDGHRPARGIMEVAHILIRKKFKGVTNPNASKEAEDVFLHLKNGKSFKSMVVQRSQDNNTKNKDGLLPEFGIGKYETSFEDAAFSLMKDGDFTEPVESSLGFHIIKRVSKNEMQSFEKMQNDLFKRTKQKDRQAAGKEQLNEEIKSESGYTCDDNVMETFIQMLDGTFYEYKWTAPLFKDEVLCTLGNEKYMLSHFVKFCKAQGRSRMQNNHDVLLSIAVKELYAKFIDEKTIDYQQERLEEKYIDFRNLMREYEEGILLFEITKEEVWDKASNDADGIASYYSAHEKEYKWNERAEVEEYSIRSTDASVITKILKKAGRQDAEKVASSFNKTEKKPELVMYSDKVYEKEDEEMKGLTWKSGALTAPNINNALKMTTFKKVKRIIPASQKTLDEARGFVISDYQMELEKKWLVELKKKYKVNIIEPVLAELIK